jgi:hypothetical protein
MLNELYLRNKILTIAGVLFFIASLCIGIYAIFNPLEVLGINSMIKPLKFSISTCVYSFTLAYLLFYVNNQKKVKQFSILAVTVMLYENSIIIIQAVRGKLSHFNQSELIDGILYAIMGIMIVWLTTATLVLTIRFITQKTYSIPQNFVLSIKIGLVLFVIFSFFGGYMSVINSHNIGGKMGGDALPLVNWSNRYGDLRVAHFFGIHALQIIPLFGYFIVKKNLDPVYGNKIIWFFSFLYFAFVCFTMVQAMSGIPLI